MASTFVIIDGAEYEVEVEGGVARRIRLGEGEWRAIEARLEDIEGARKALVVDGASQRVGLLARDGARIDVQLAGRPTIACEVYDELSRALVGESLQQGELFIKSPMPGVVLDVRARPGLAVAAGDVLLILEAMKTENEICAQRDGVIKAVHVEAGQTVANDDLLVELEDPEDG